MAKKKGAEGKRTGRSAAQRTATSTAGGLCSTAQDFDHAGKEAAMFLESSPSSSQKSTRSSAARSTPTKSSSEAPKFSPSRPRPIPGSSTSQSKLRSPDSEASRWTAFKEVIDGIRYTYYEDDMKEVEKMTPQECINFLQEHAGEELPAIFQGGQEQSEGQQAAEKLHLKTEVIDGIAYTYYQEDMDEAELMSPEECIKYLEEQEEKMRQRNELRLMMLQAQSLMWSFHLEPEQGVGS